MGKKLMSFAAAILLALTLSACGGTAVKLPALTLETSSAVSGGAEAVREKPDPAKYQDTLFDLLTYMKDGGAITWDTEAVSLEGDSLVIAEGTTSFTQMSYKEIGAENGYRCQFTFHSSTVQAEFYHFDPQNLNEKGEACLSSVEEKGSFEIMGNKVKAVLHPSKKYLMIYTDANAEKKDENKAQKEWAEELFLAFQA